MAEILKDELEDKDIIHTAQFAFSSGFGAVHQAANLAGKVEETAGKKLKGLVALFDVEKAYDKAWRGAITEKMSKHGINHSVVSMIHMIINNRTFVVKIGGSRSVEREMRDGLPQGGPLSPFLYNILVGDLPKDKMFKETMFYQFADDTAIFVRSRTWSWTIKRMQKEIARLGKYFADNRIAVNPAKTQIMRIGNKLEFGTTVNVLGKELIPKFRMIYLGVRMNAQVNWSSHIRYRITLGRMTFQRLYYSLGPKSNLSLCTKAKIIKTIIEKQVAYGEEVWAHHQPPRSLRAFQRECMRKITGAPWYVASDELRRDLRMIHPWERAMEAREKMRIKFQESTSPDRREIVKWLF